MVAHTIAGSCPRGLQAIVFTCMCLALCACHEHEPKAPEARTRIVFKHSKIFGDPRVLGRLIEEFERTHPQIQVQDEEIPASAGEQHQLYVINLEGQSPTFDVFSIDIIWIAEFARAGWIVPLDGILDPETQQDYFPATMTAARYQGGVYAVPWFIDAGLLYYRSDLLANYGLASPRTWDDLIRAAQKVSAGEGIYGFVWEGKQSEGLICNTLEYLWGRGGEVLREGQAVIESPENRAALELMRDLIVKYRITPPVVTSMTEEGARQLFTAGKAVFIRNWPYMWNVVQREGSPLRGKVGLAPLPSFPGHESVSTLGGWYLAVNRYSTQRAAAEEFVRFMAQPDVQKNLALGAGFQPPRRALYRDPELLAQQPALPLLEIVFRGARPRPVSPFYLQISEMLQPEFSAVLVGNRTVDEALHAGQERLQRILLQAQEVQ